MKFLQQVLNFYINTSIHVAIAVFSLVQITKLSLNISANSSLDWFIFFGTIVGYNVLKYADVFWTRIFTFKKNYLIIMVSFFAFLGMIYFYFQLKSDIQIAFIKIGILVLIYPFFRKFALLKMIFVSFCLTLVTVFVLESKHDYLYALQRFLIVFCLLIPLEICDIKNDAKTIKTLPQVIGIRNLKFLGYLLLILVCVLSYFFLQLKFNIVIAIAISIVIAIFIFFSENNQSKYYTSFWVESLPILWLMLLLIF